MSDARPIPGGNTVKATFEDGIAWGRGRGAAGGHRGGGARGRDGGRGANCLGFVNYVDGVPLTSAVTPARTLTGPAAAIVAQSGAMASVVRASLQSRDIDVSFAVSTGNEAANGIEDFIADLLERPETRLLVLVTEHIRDPQRFLQLARHARQRGIPVVLLHLGRSAGARNAVTTHTGALAGDHAVVRARGERQSVLVVDTLEELVDVAECLLRCPSRAGRRIAVLGESGAFKALMLDYGQGLGVRFPQPAGEAEAALNAISPGFIVGSNPLDLTAQPLNQPELYGRAVDAMMANPVCGTLLVVIILTSPEMARRKLPPVIEMLREWSQRRAVCDCGRPVPWASPTPPPGRACRRPTSRWSACTISR